MDYDVYANVTVISMNLLLFVNYLREIKVVCSIDCLFLKSVDLMLKYAEHHNYEVTKNTFDRQMLNMLKNVISNISLR